MSNSITRSSRRRTNGSRPVPRRYPQSRGGAGMGPFRPGQDSERRDPRFCCQASPSARSWPQHPRQSGECRLNYITSVAPRGSKDEAAIDQCGGVRRARTLRAVLAQQASSSSDTSSAAPPSHRHAHHAAHGKPSHHPGNFPNVQGNVANQLNEAELTRLQSGNMSMPPAAPPPGMAPSMAPPAQGGPPMTRHGTVQ